MNFVNQLYFNLKNVFNKKTKSNVIRATDISPLLMDGLVLARGRGEGGLETKATDFHMLAGHCKCLCNGSVE